MPNIKQEKTGVKHTKVCRVCKEEKQLTKDFFYFRPDTETWRNQCRVCQKEYWDSRRKTIGSVDHLRILLRDAKCRAKKRNIKFTLTKEDLKELITNTCPILDMELVIGMENWYDSPSLDRIDNTEGYEKGNVIMVSLMANSIKNQATPDQIQKVATFYKKLYKERGIAYG